MAVPASPAIQAYFDALETTFNAALSLAKQARAKKLDPSEEVEIAPAADVAARVEGLVGPAGVTQRIRELSSTSSREHACFEIAKEIVQGKFAVGEYAEGEGANSEKRIEQAVRTGLALFTEGVVSAPIEGISHVKIRDNPDGSKFLALYFAGPIRGAGGTGQAFALLIADHCRQIAKISNYRPTGDEVDRYVEECNLYARKTRAGQYVPTQEEIKHIVNNCAVCIDGEPTEDYEVSSNRNLASVPSNKVRSGLVLVISEGVCLKAAKVLKISKKAGLDWSWVEKLIKVTKQDASKVEIKPNAKFMHDIVAGRPIFSYPMRAGGWRLRYGRTPFTGIAAKAINPAAMHLLDEFPAIGTQLKVERPGKGCIVTPCENIEGPTVRLKSGDVVQVNSLQQAQMLAPQVDSVLFLGDMLINYGDFSKANHLLVPSGYVEEWFVQDLDAVGVKKTVAEALAMGAREAITLAVDHSIPLAPKYSYCWQDVDAPSLRTLVDWLASGKAVFEWFDFIEHRVPKGAAKEVAENLGIPHRVDGNDVVFDADYGLALLSTLGLLKDKALNTEKFDAAYSPEKSAMEIISATAPFKVRNRVGIYIGSSMGRPEKAKPRLMKPPVHSLFPIGMHGGKLRSVVRAVKTLQAENTRAITVEAANKLCPIDGTVTWRNTCPACKGHTVLAVRDPRTGKMTVVDAITEDNKRDLYSEKQVDLVNEFKNACEKTNTRLVEMKAVMGLISPSKIPEPLEKGVLRAKHGITVFRDGTGRFDATEVPATHFSCRDASLTVEQAKALGYTVDVKGNPLQDESQVIELKPQDIILASDGIDYLLRLTAFIDDLLLYFYGLQPYYNCKTAEDLLGKQGILIAPHTSAGILTRVIGFSPVRGIIAHPYVHCATRRNCLAPDTPIFYSDDGSVRVETFEELFTRYAAEFGTKDNGGDETITPSRPISFFSVDAGMRKMPVEVKKIFRRRHSGQLLKIAGGNSIELSMTPDHRALVWQANKLVEKRASELRVGDTLVSLTGGSKHETSEEPIERFGDVCFSRITRIDSALFEGCVYDVELNGENHVFACGKGMMLTHNCDGDELCFILLLDGLLNFSRFYLPASRGGQMDAPLVLTIKLDPKEVDDEVHAMDCAWSYPKEFYEATQKVCAPGEVKLDTVAARLGTPSQFEGLGYTHDATMQGPVQSSYVKLGTMAEKVEVELELMKRIRAVDVAGAAERIILAHFFPDLYGNLRSFSKQSFRCVECNSKYRRVPLQGKCSRCGGKILLTINKGGIEKYLRLSKDMAERYNLPTYLKQRLLLIEKEIESIFENEAVKQYSIADYL